MLPGTEFQRLIPDSGPASENPDTTRRVIFCTGKIYYDLLKERADRNLISDVAINRIEQVIIGNNLGILFERSNTLSWDFFIHSDTLVYFLYILVAAITRKPYALAVACRCSALRYCHFLTYVIDVRRTTYVKKSFCSKKN